MSFASLTPHFQAKLLEKHAALVNPASFTTWQFTPIISACLEIKASPKIKLDASNRKAHGKVAGVHEDKRDKLDKRDKKADAKKPSQPRRQIVGDDGLPRITIDNLSTAQRMKACRAVAAARARKRRVPDFTGQFQTFRVGNENVDAVCHQLPGDPRTCCGAPGHFPDRCPIMRAAQPPS